MPQSFRTQRLTQGWTLEDLAAHARTKGVKASTGQISEIERGHRVPAPGLRAVLCRLLDLPITYFAEPQQEEPLIIRMDGRKNQGSGTRQTPKGAPKPPPKPKPQPKSK